MKYYLKQTFIPVMYLIFMTMIAFSILLIGDDLMWLKIVLLLLNIALYCSLVGAISYKEGEFALTTRVANDVERRNIIRTGEDLPLKLHEEYKVWKGFFFGFLACVPLIVMMIIHTILYFAMGPQYDVCGRVSSFIYMAFASLAQISSEVEIQQWHYYFTLISVPIIMITTGVPYIFGARKIQRQQDRIKEKHRQIYGEDD
ncbi:MAG: hypothetical protein E7347_00110 [Clostridiales bacterium]|nr:hypothetical protein [Clostridiales bacterium]